jgi:hypothetical protein
MKFEIVHDVFADSPRETQENVFEFTFHHTKYNLPNELGIRAEAFNSWEDMASYLKPRYALVVPVHMYDHSGTYLSVKSFGCSWDSGRVGFAVLSKERMLKEFGRKYITNKLNERLMKILEQEVADYTMWLNGECYGVQILDDDNEMLDCQYGFYGMEAARESAVAYMSHYGEVVTE